MCGCCFKTHFNNFKNGWISSENMFVEEGETSPKLAGLLTNELFVALDEGESSSTTVFSPCGTKVRNCAAMLSQIREKLSKRPGNELITVRKIANDLLET